MSRDGRADWAQASAGKQEFAGTAVRLAGLAGVMFGWRPDEFWRATPDELGALVRAVVPAGAEPGDAWLIARLQEAYPDG